MLYTHLHDKHSVPFVISQEIEFFYSDYSVIIEVNSNSKGQYLVNKLKLLTKSVTCCCMITKGKNSIILMEYYIQSFANSGHLIVSFNWFNWKQYLFK